MSEYEEVICWECNGSGEGSNEHIKCKRCNGTGTIILINEEE